MGILMGTPMASLMVFPPKELSVGPFWGIRPSKLDHPNSIIQVGASKLDNPSWTVQVGSSKLDGPSWTLQVG
jgi:hypothetical protein